MRKISLKILLSVILVSICSLNTYSQTHTFRKELALLKRVDLLPAYRHNQLIDQESSYDRTWGNDDGFSGKYSYIRKENGHLVLAEFEGPRCSKQDLDSYPYQRLAFVLFRWRKNTAFEDSVYGSLFGKSVSVRKTGLRK